MSDQLQASIAVVTIKIDGTDVSKIEHDLEEVVVDTTYNLPSMATIRLHDPRLTWIKSTQFDIGKKLSITLGAPKSINAVAPQVVFDGEVVALEPYFDSQGNHTLTIRGYDISHRLHIGTHSRSFLKMTDSDIVKKVAQEAGLQATVTTTSVKYDHIIQNNQTDMEFLSERARRIGYHLTVKAGKLNFLKTSSPPAGPLLELGEDLRSLSMRMSAARQSTKFSVRGWDYKSKKEIVANSNSMAAWNENGVGKTGGAVGTSAFGGTTTLEIVDLVPKSPDEADLIAQAAAVDQEGEFVEADGVAYGDPKLIAGVQVELKGLGPRFSGKYFVTSATHIYNAAGYDIHFTVSGRFPQTISHLLHSGQNGTQRGLIEGVVTAIVTNVADPENIGRVKLKYPWLSETVESDWTRIAMPSAGAERGFFFLPEVNDEVLVAFEHGNVNSPFVVGALWNGKDKPPETSAKAHTGGSTVHRIIASRKNHQIVFDDADGKESILIIDKTTKQSILIDSVKNGITILADGDLTIDVKRNINIKAGANINIEAVGNISAEGMNVEVKANGMGKVEANGTLDLKGNGPTTVESAALTTVKGNLTNVEATTAMVIKGLTVAIN